MLEYYVIEDGEVNLSEIFDNESVICKTKVTTVEEKKLVQKKPILPIRFINEKEKTSIKIPAVVDTGASICTMGCKLYNELKWEKEPVTSKIFGIEGNGKGIIPEGRTVALIKIDNADTEVMFQFYIISTLDRGVLLGTDLINALGITVQLKNGIFKLLKENKKNNFIKINEATIRPLTANDFGIMKIKKENKNIKIERQIKLAEAYFCDPTESLLQTLKTNINEKLT